MPRDYYREYSRNYYYRQKSKFIKLLGGKCANCSSTYKLQFDHIDCNDKKFNFSNFMSHSKEDILKELKKCQLLCRRCHDKKSKKEGSLAKNRVIGSKNHNSKLNEEKVTSIKKELSYGTSMKILSEKFNVSYETIKFIKAGKTWKHVT